jgi:HD-like signal output (HDOD) protein
MSEKNQKLDQTFERLLQAAQRRGELPSFSQSARSIIVALSAGDEDNDTQLVQAILSDATLTQRVLRLANSAMYAMFGGQVGTVSRAVQVLGLHTVAHLALGLKMLDAVTAEAKGQQEAYLALQDSVVAGHIGREIASLSAPLKDSEAASVCSILHSLGRVLVSLYLPKEYQDIQRMQNERVALSEACESVLGGSYADLAWRMAQHWGLPPNVTASLSPEDAPDGHTQWLRQVARSATEFSQARSPHETKQLAQFWASRLGLEADTLLAAAKNGRRQVEAAAAAVAVKPKNPLQELREVAKKEGRMRSLQVALEVLFTELAAERGFTFMLLLSQQVYKAQQAIGKGATAQAAHLQFDSRFEPNIVHLAMSKDKAIHLENTGSESVYPRMPQWWQQRLGASAKACTLVPVRVHAHTIALLYLQWAQEKKLTEEQQHLLGQVKEILQSG